MNRFNELYLFRLFRQNKILFGFVMLFIFFQQYFYLKDNSTFPWFIWSMYSHKEYLPETVTQTEIFVDHKRLDISSVPIWQEATIMHTFNKYLQLKNNNFNDPIKEVVHKRILKYSPAIQKYVIVQIENKKTNAEKYPVWIHHYLETEIFHKKINNIEFKEIQYHYHNNQFIKDDTSRTLLTIDI